MSDKKNNLNKNLEKNIEDFLYSTYTPQSKEIELRSNIYYNCTECNSLIEILSIDEKNNLIEFKCSTRNHGDKEEQKMPIKEYLEKMDRYINKDITDVCKIHKKKKYRNYCFDCKSHLCEECIKTKLHKNHKKIDIIEEQPNDEELNIIKNRIKNYKNEIINLKNEKEKILNELKEKFNYEKIFENENFKKIEELNIKKEKNELKMNKDKYLYDIKEIKRKYENEKRIRYNKYINKINEIVNKYKFINNRESIIYKYKIKDMEQKFNSNKIILKFDKKIENIFNIKKLIEIIYNAYNTYNNN